MSLQNRKLHKACEAMLMVAQDPVSAMDLAAVLEVPLVTMLHVLEDLRAEYDGKRACLARGFELRELAGGWKIYARAEYDPTINRLMKYSGAQKLSQAAYETLAIIAYKQPISKSAISAIRAVNADSVVRTLLSKGLIVEMFVDSETSATQYGTSSELLVHLGINTLDELPRISHLLEDGTESLPHEQ